MNIVLSGHARFEIARRQLPEEAVKDVAQNPQQVVKLRSGRLVCQSKYHVPTESKEMILRVICEEHYDTLFVVTAYRTSKIEKYWQRGGPT